MLKRLFSIAWLLAVSHSVIAGPDWPRAVNDMRYGVALFNFYQEDYFSSLTELLIAEHHGGVKGHGDFPKLLKGGISLSYGLDKEAERIFNDFLDDNTPASTQDRARFFLGKLRYQRRNDDLAERDLLLVGKKLPDSFKDEMSYMQANLAIRKGEFDQAQKLMKSLRKKSAWLPYLYFNLGAANAANGDWRDSVKQLNKLNSLKTVSHEVLSLQDKGNTASGYTYLLAGEYDKAVSSFKDVRLDSPLVDKALLGYGWAAAQQQDFSSALQPWQQLAKRSVVHEAVQEVLLAIPFAYEKLGAQGHALEELNKAVNVYLAELSNVDTAMKRLASQPSLDFFLDQERPSLQWVQSGSDLPVSEQLPYLASLVADQEFQNTLSEMRELEILRANLNHWQGSILAYKTELKNRQYAREQKRRELDTALIEGKIFDYLQQRDQFEKIIAAAEESQDIYSLLNAEEQALVERVNQAKEKIVSLSARSEKKSIVSKVVRQNVKLARYQGILHWQLSETFPNRLRAAKKGLIELDHAIAELKGSKRSLAFAIDNSPELDGYDTKIETMEYRIVQQQQSVELVYQQVDDELRRLTGDRLQQHKKRIETYLAQARLAIARIYDRYEDAS